MHPLVKQTLDIAQDQGISKYDLAARSGLNPNIFYYWQTRSTPVIQKLEAVLNALDYKLRIVKNDSD